MGAIRHIGPGLKGMASNYSFGTPDSSVMSCLSAPMLIWSMEGTVGTTGLFSDAHRRTFGAAADAVGSARREFWATTLTNSPEYLSGRGLTSLKKHGSVNLLSPECQDALGF